MTVNAERIDLASTVITIEQSNTFFASNTVLRGGFSYPIQLAHTSKNRRIFKFFDLLETNPSHPQIPVFMRMNGRFHTEAILQLGMASGGFSGHLLLKNAAINEKLDASKLTDIRFPVFDIGDRDALWNNMVSTRSKNKSSETPYTFLPTKNNDFFSSVDPKQDRVLNHSIGLAFQQNSPDKWAPIVPYFYLCNVLENMARYLNLNLCGDFAQHADVQKLVITNPVGLGLPYGIKINAKNHLPPLPLKEFFKELSIFFGTTVRIADSDLNISFKKSVFDRPMYMDWTGKKMSIISQEFTPIRDGFHLSADAEGLDQKDEVIVGNGKIKINAKVASLPFCSLQGHPNPIPEYKCKGVLLPHGFKADEKTKDLYAKPGEPPNFPLRLLFCNNDGAPKSSNTGHYFNLKMSGRNGLYEFAHSPWMEKTHAARVIKIRVLLNGADLQQLDESKIIRLKSISGAVVECMWRRLTFSASEGQNIIPAEVELVVLNPSKI